MLTDKHDRFLFWLERCKSPYVLAIRFSWQEGKPYNGKMFFNMRNKKKEFVRLNNSFKEK